jgi:hypothetical protein
VAIDFDDFVHASAEIYDYAARDSRGGAAVANVAAHGYGVDGDDVLICPFHDRRDLGGAGGVDNGAADHFFLADDVVGIVCVAASCELPIPR